MSRSLLWRELESGNGLVLRILRFTILAGGLLFLLVSGTIDLTWPQQGLLGILMVGLAIWMNKSSSTYVITLTLILASLFSTFRYGYWRISTTAHFFLDPASHWSALDAFFILLLLGAECYAFLTLLLGYMQTLWPLRRAPMPLPEDPDLWPAVDLLIPTFNEPLSVVRFTALAAMNIDWPVDKLNVFLLDDGKREEFKKFAEEAGIGYLTREDNKYAKAGNINHALQKVSAPFVAVFDSDHVPTRSFLQVTLGWFLQDRRLGVLQTPHHLYSPDPFERNLNQFRVVPNEGELFYGVVQDGNDFWNATVFCGSCAVLRRTALDEIGGIAVETVTEDAHTSLRMQMKGWNTAYINIPQAGGLATERLSSHIKQRIRWARGMVQILRIDNPLFARGLNFAQRLCYFNAMTHFLYALPRLIFLSAPLIYLIFGRTNIPGYWATVLAFAFPHLVLSSLTNSRIQGKHRHSFWNEIYETVLAPYLLLPTMLALINPKLGAFHVTEKGGLVGRPFFDTRIAQPFLLMLLFNLIGIALALPRFHFMDVYGLRALYDGSHPGTIAMNLLWSLFNLVIIGVATSVAWENQQRRQTVRVSLSVLTDLVLADGKVLQGLTADISSGGVLLNMQRNSSAKPGEHVTLVVPVLDGDASLPATVISVEGRMVRAQFEPLSLQQEEALTMVLYSRADTWLGWGEARDVDRPLSSFSHILQLFFHGLSQTLRGMIGRRDDPPKGRLATSIAPLLLLALLTSPTNRAARAAQSQPGLTSTAAVRSVHQSSGTPARTANRLNLSPKTSAPGEREVPPGSFSKTYTFADLGISNSIALRGSDAVSSVSFPTLPSESIKSAILHLRYHFSPALIASASHLKVSLNGTLLRTLPITRLSDRTYATTDLNSTRKAFQNDTVGHIADGEEKSLLEADLAIPVALLARSNEFTFEFIGHYALQNEDRANSTLWSQIDKESTIKVAGNLVALKNDLSLFPQPFYDAAVDHHPIISIVFLAPPSFGDLQAASIVASYFGVLANSVPMRFKVTVGALPPGDAVVIGRNAAELLPTLQLPPDAGPGIVMRTHPNNPYAKLLLLTGETSAELLVAAESLVLGQGTLQGEEQKAILRGPLPRRRVDDAPRWLSTDHARTFEDLEGSAPRNETSRQQSAAQLRLPPDLFFGTVRNLDLHLHYAFGGLPLAPGSSLGLYANAAYVRPLALPRKSEEQADLNVTVPIPLEDIRPFSNTFSARLQSGTKAMVEDGVTPPTVSHGAVREDSFLDIRGLTHLAVLPNLELFANAGFPFTRMADLADTAVVLSKEPTADEIELLLTLMGHFGAQTGYPVFGITVTDDAGMRSDASKDYLVLGTEDQPTLSRLNHLLPVRIEAAGISIQQTYTIFSGLLGHPWWRVESSDRVHSDQLQATGTLPEAVVEAMEWPQGSGRSLVLIAVRDHAAFSTFSNVFLRTSQSSDMAQSVSLLKGAHFNSYRIGGEVYRIGSLSPRLRLNLIFLEYPWLLVASTLLLSFLMAIILRTMLRRRARLRLQAFE